MIYSINEGIIKHYKNRKNLRSHNMDQRQQDQIDGKNKTASISKPTPTTKPQEKKQMFTNDEFNEIYEKAEALYTKHWNRLQSEIKKFVSKTSVAKAYKYYPDEGCEFLKDDLWGGVGFDFPCVFSGLIMIDIWNVEPNARTDYDTSPAIKEVLKTNKEIIKIINQYSIKNNVKFHAIQTGDWDTGDIDLFISIKDLDLSFPIPANESTIFESVEFI